MMTKPIPRCPCCRQLIAPDLLFGRRRIQQKIYDYIACHPEGVTREQVIEAVYGDREDGGPESYSIISAHLNKMRPALHAAGLDITSAWELGRGIGYRLVEREAQP
jgi:DNA-binding response OmpR family regulator